jgi:hypothetical protein
MSQQVALRLTTRTLLPWKGGSTARPPINTPRTRPALTARASSTTSAQDIRHTAYDALAAAQGVYLVSSQTEVTLTDLWSAEQGQRAVIALGRSMG